ncbi:sulfatase-like hydrolase/transferase [candidate division KSB1 bacterium]|nr:sulfatase-like hydrolase/transferase [candidate division KSB1 bacterium]
MKNLNRRTFLKHSSLGLLGVSLMGCASKQQQSPNFVIIFIDDMGYGDTSRTGHPTISTPNLDRLADQGVTMTQFYSVAAVCSPSRAALLTGRYQIRNGVTKVLFPYHDVGLPKTEKTLASLLKQKSYATACIGKWHLGHHPEFLPTSHGFDYYYGIPYSNDMDVKEWGGIPTPLMRNETIIEQPCDQTTITKRYTQESKKFIQEHKDKPFFLYLAHTMPHFPLFRSEKFVDISRRGLYGDVISELDWSVGQIMDCLKQQGLEKNTLLIFTSDNGPWTMKGVQGGSSGLLRGGKASTFEGGVREPFIARFPGKLPAGSINMEVATTMDLFTTCLTLAGVPVPDDRPIDGNDLMPVWRNEQSSKSDPVYFYWDDKLAAMRSGKYKLHFRKHIGNWVWVDCDPLELYDLEIDPSEKYEISAQFPEIVSRLTEQAEKFKKEIAERGENKELIEKLENWQQS